MLRNRYRKGEKSNMSNYNKLLNNLDKLKLNKFKDNIDEYIDMANNKKKDFVEALYDLTNYEIKYLD